MNSRLLVVEDDAGQREALGRDLSAAGYEVLLAPDGISGLTLARTRRPDLVILDLGLPDLDGLEVARRLRATSDLPIIVLTVLDDVQNKVALFEANADDYLVKPCDPVELRARVARQLRRVREVPERRVGRLFLDLREREAQFGDRPLRLTALEFELLALLARRPGRLYSREEIAWGLWRRPGLMGRNVIETHVASVRAKLRAVGGEGMIRTARGLGYALRSHEEKP